MIVDILDSYFLQVKNTMANVDNTQRFGGIVNARDWPQTKPNEGALYLVYVSANQKGGSIDQQLTECICQWCWILIGDDIAANKRAENRGSRFRSSMTIENNLRQANWPGFTRKINVSGVDQQTGALTITPVVSTAPRSDIESVWWSALKFVPQLDNERTGFTYGVATVTIYGYDDVLASLANS